MLEYGFKGTIIVNGEEVDKADMWKQDEVVQEAVSEIVDNHDEELLQVSVLTQEGADRLYEELTHPSPDNSGRDSMRKAGELVAAVRAAEGLDNSWFREEFGEDFEPGVPGTLADEDGTF